MFDDPRLLSAQVGVVLDVLGTFVFAVSGGLVAARARLDVFGFVVLALAAGCAGGVVRDLLIGDTPPAAITDWRYAAACVVAGLGVFALGQQSVRVTDGLRVVDAVGLGIFAVAGTVKSLDVADSQFERAIGLLAVAGTIKLTGFLVSIFAHSDGSEGAP